MTFWLLFLFAAGLVSIVVVNPVPFIIVAVLAATIKPGEDALRADAGSTGPTPTDGAGCLAWVIGAVVMAALVLFCIAMLIAIVEGRTL